MEPLTSRFERLRGTHCRRESNLLGAPSFRFLEAVKDAEEDASSGRSKGFNPWVLRCEYICGPRFMLFPAEQPPILNEKRAKYMY